MFPAKHHAMDHCPWLDPQNRDEANNPAPRLHQAKGVTYDTESGQVYMEKTVRAPRKKRTNWINEYKTPGLIKRGHTNGEGAASLFNMAKAKVARQMQHLTRSHLEGIPPLIGKKLWDEVEKSRLETFHTWRTLVSAFPDILTSPSRRYFMDIKEPVVPLVEYFAGLDSKSVRWLSCLRIAPSNIDRSDMVRISQLQNLAVLDLSDHPSIDNAGTQVDERIFKTWAEMAKAGQAFKHVCVILMRGQADVSTWLFKYLDIFPSLCSLILSDCRLIHQKNRADWTDQASAYGWEARHSKKSVKSLRGLIDDKNFYLGAVSGCYYHTKEAFDQLATKKKTKFAERLPVVEVWIGKPKPWLHLIEEFPGTRTVWFDNIKTKEYVGKAEARRRTDASVLAKAARVALPERISTPPAEDGTKRTRDMLSSPGSEMKSPPHKRTTMMLRSQTKNLNEVMADFG